MIDREKLRAIVRQAKAHSGLQRQRKKKKLNVKVKVKYILVQALRLCTGRTAHRGSSGIVLLFHDHGTRRG